MHLPVAASSIAKPVCALPLPVPPSAFDETRADKILPRHFLHGTKHALIADPAPAQRQLKFHALDIVGGWLHDHNCLAYQPGVAVFSTPHGLLHSAAYREPYCRLSQAIKSR